MEFEEAAKPVPSQRAFEEMRRHLAEEHQRELNPELDVFRADNPRAGAVLSHRAETPGQGEAFYCAQCPGRVFLVAEPTLDEARIAHLGRHDQELGWLLEQVDAKDRAELVQAHQAKTRSADLLKRQRRRARQQTKKVVPAAAERKQRAQAYLLAKYEEIGTVEEALWDLAQLRIRNPKAYRQIMGDEHDYKLETLRKYWGDIDGEEREAAKQRFRKRQGSE